MKIGYARVSTDEQNLALQEDALFRAGCEVLYSDQGVSGAEFSRPGLNEAMAALSSGDTLVVWRLDRLGRSLAKLIELISHLGKQDVGFVSLTESIDTSSAGGVLMFHMMAALSEFERRLISERTRAGMHAAREHGKRLGRKPLLSRAQCRQAAALLKTRPVSDVARKFNVHPRTLKRALSGETQSLQASEGAANKD
ncbi:recombinase family protein [Burkholderia latens]|uniref:Recombinase n=1 Tax=Burkholderia latens TaxID=488446 RepID=A0A6H9T2D7_9BURK|nr:recombinase family protein [Burkholderia latens]KAB0644982.1 recombinase family protein [Burkholderia latens]VWB16730.1 recombinase [Burkholderia latens]